MKNGIGVSIASVLVLSLLCQLTLADTVNQFEDPNIEIHPDKPMPGEEITVYADITQNVSEVLIIVCPADYCLPQADMEMSVSGTYRYSFYVNETAEVELHIKMVDNGNVTWYNATSFNVGEKDNGLPGFIAVAGVLAFMAIFLKRRFVTLK
jgi:hypothetical protein